MLTQWFHPEPFFKGLPFARALQGRGHQVQVLTGFPNYPGGAIYPGYRVRGHQVEDVDGVIVHRVPLYPSHDTGAIGRVANYVSFALAAACIGPFVIERPDLIYVYHPPATVGLPAMVLSKRFGCPYVYDVQDLWPDTLRATGMVNSRVLLGLVGRWCRLVYAAASRVVVLSPGFKRRIVARGVSADQVEVIPNWAEEFGEPAGPAANPSAERARLFEVLFAGNLGKVQQLDTILAAADRLRVSRPQVRFRLMGDGIERARLEASARSQHLDNVVFVPRGTPAEAARAMADADALLVHLQRDELFEITIPSKTQAYLQAGRPILMGVEGDAADLVMRAGAGLCFSPEDPESLAAAVTTLTSLTMGEREAMGQRGRDFYRRELALSVATDRFDALFHDLVEARLSR